MNDAGARGLWDATIRPGRDEDAAGIIALIGACWAEYPSMVFDVPRELPELHALASHFVDKGGQLWTAEADGALVGMVATYRLDGDTWEIARMYVAAPWRGGGLASRLLRQAEAYARAHGARRLTLWTDTRFDRAHRFYERHSYVRAGPLRILDDLSGSIEFVYAKPVAGIERLDAAAAASAERRLADLLQRCVQDGGSVSFIAPLSFGTAREYWHGIAAEIARGSRVLLAAWSNAALVGTVMLDLATTPDQPHRAELQMLLVDPEVRRQGIGRVLLARAEEEARHAGRTLLTLGTRASDPAEALFRAAGWTEAGQIPGYRIAPDRTPCGTAFFYKRV